MGMAFKQAFDTALYDDIGPAQLPAGTYQMTFKDMKQHKPRSGGAPVAKLEFSARGEVNGVFNEYISLWHPRPETRDLAMRSIATIVRALMGGDGVFTNSNQWVGNTCEADIVEQDEAVDGKVYMRAVNWRPVKSDGGTKPQSTDSGGSPRGDQRVEQDQTRASEQDDKQLDNVPF